MIGSTARLSDTTTAGSDAYPRETLGSARTVLTASGDFDITAEGLANANVPLFRLYDAGGARLVSLYRQDQDYNQVWVADAANTYDQTSATVPLNTWVHVELHVVANGSGASTIGVAIDGTRVLTTTAASPGTAGAFSMGYRRRGSSLERVKSNPCQGRCMITIVTIMTWHWGAPWQRIRRPGRWPLLRRVLAR